MLQIRPQQMQAFEQAALKSFESRMVEHIQKHFPKHFELLGEPVVRKAIQLGIDRGGVQGLITEHDLCLFITLMFLLGSSFDEDPQLPWADALLSDESIEDSAERTERLWDEAIEYLDYVAGEENEYVIRALVTLSKHPAREAWQASQGTLEERILAQLQAVWPQKHERVGLGALRHLVHRGTEAAERYGLADGFAVAVYVVLMFMLGSGFDTDPQFPWAAAILSDASPAGRATRADRLYDEAMAYASKWLQ